MMAVALTVAAALATDGRSLLTTKNELQNFTDSISLSAVIPLDVPFRMSTTAVRVAEGMGATT